MVGVRPGQLTPAQLNAAVFKATKGQLVGPVKTPFGYYVFTIDSTTPGKTQTVLEATPTIRATIAAVQQSAANASLQADFTKKWAQLTKCSSGYVIPSSCGNAPATTTTPTTTTPTTTTPTTGATGAT
jgi:foldase protein PrsA